MAHIREPFVRETFSSSGTDDFALSGAMFSSIPFGEVMADGDTCDYAAQAGGAREEGTGTYVAATDTLERTTVTRSKHANGDVDTNKVSFGSGGTIILTVRAGRAAALDGSLRFDVAQTLSAGEKTQLRANGVDYIPAGTKMLFVQASVPTGWTLDTTHNDKALRIVNTTGAGTGGSVNFSTVFARTQTDAFTFLRTHLPNITFDISGITVNNGSSVVRLPSGSFEEVAAGNDRWGFSKGDAVKSTITVSGGTAASGGSGTAIQMGMDIRVKYVDAIIGTKD